jgi:site-specific DNA-adenine methylase
MTSYHGGKQKIGKKIAEEIVKNVQDYLPYVKGYCEPFCGMLGVYRHIPTLFSILFQKCSYKAGDYNKSLIMMWQQAQKGWVPPTSCTERKYNELKDQTRASSEKGFIGHQYSFAGQYFKGYRGIYGNKGEYKKASENVSDIATELKDVVFSQGKYTQFSRLKNYIIYCDPPYTDNSKSYYFDEEHTRLSFDHIEFWEWCLKMSKNNIVFVSEYTCPKEFEKDKRIKKVYQKSVKLSGASPIKRKRTEKLYMIVNY